jgi:hypothetical protein
MKLEEIRNILKPETELEKRIISDPEFIEGAAYGKIRKGHPEGQVVYHIREVLDNIDKMHDQEYRENMRLIALIHDTFKYKVDQTKPKVGMNHHAMIARKFAEKFNLGRDILDIIEWHDEAYNAWQQGGRKGDWYKAEKRASELIKKLENEDRFNLYLEFYYCDNRTGDKEQDNYDWFFEFSHNGIK